MKSAEVLACSFPEWYSKFKKITYKSVVIPLEKDFIDYLLADNLVLPENGAASQVREESSDTSSESEADPDEVDWAEAERETPALIAPTFDALDISIKEAIAELGGQVFAKLNWSAPQDAAWISLNSCLKCYTPSDIYLLLKSSDFITHDLTQPFTDCEDVATQEHKVSYHLVLRRWVDMNPGNEFRCFVQNHCLVGITQRDVSNYYSYMSPQRSDIMRDIQSFFKEHILNYFPLKNYVFDVVRQSKEQLRLVDFNPYGPTTDSLLFDWQSPPLLRDTEDNKYNYIDEPDNDCNRSVDFRFITENSGVQPNPLRQYCVPRDFVDLCSGEDPFKLMDLLRLQTQNQDQDTDDDSQ